jgi:hypothetical protein
VLPQREVKRQAKASTPEPAKAILDLTQDPWRIMFAIAAYRLRRARYSGFPSRMSLGARRADCQKDRWYGRIQTAKSLESENPVPIVETLAETLRGFIGERREGLIS